MCDALHAILRRLTRNIGLLGSIGAGCMLAAGASAAPTPTLFRLTLAGTARATWTYTGAPSDDGSCETTETSEGTRTAKFRSAEVVVRIAGGRVLPTDLGGVAGTVSTVGSNSTERTCGGVGRATIADCVASKRSFVGAKVRVEGSREALAIGAIRNLRLRRAICPFEPPQVESRPVGPVPSPLRLPARTLTNGRIARLTLQASATRRTTFASPEAGQLDERSDWTLTFVRVQP
jgi:hypothetical protein